jgi:hypothetical protein
MPTYRFERHYRDGRVEHDDVDYLDGVILVEGLEIEDGDLVWRVRQVAHAEGYAAKVIVDEHAD